VCGLNSLLPEYMPGTDVYSVFEINTYSKSAI